jgi:hypothetical protein
MVYGDRFIVESYVGSVRIVLVSKPPELVLVVVVLRYTSLHIPKDSHGSRLVLFPQ